MLGFETVDVFTATRFAGNPLAVVFGGESLAPGQMQSIAAEFNLSETAFVLPPPRPDVTATVRIFTPRAELPFAGHPNVGTAFVVARRGEVFGAPVGDAAVFAEQAGDVALTITRRDGVVSGAELEAPQTFATGPAVDGAAVAACCALAPGDLVTTNHAPGIGSCGVPFVFAEVASRAALRRASGVAAAFSAHIARDLAAGIYLYTRDSDAGADIDARMFAPLHGIAEDPATGSATVALGAYLGVLAGGDGESRLTVRQGVDMGRPSMMHVRARTRAGRPQRVWIGGGCVAVMGGQLDAGG